MLFSEMKKGQLLGATFPDLADRDERWRGRTFGYRVLSTFDNKFSEQLSVENTKTQERVTFVNTEMGTDWVCWKLVEPATE